MVEFCEILDDSARPGRGRGRGRLDLVGLGLTGLDLLDLPGQAGTGSEEGAKSDGSDSLTALRQKNQAPILFRIS